MIELFISLLVLLLGVSIYIIRNLVIKNDALLKLLESRDAWITELFKTVNYIDKEVRKIDTKGHFEADDEVGIFFKEIKKMKQFLLEMFEQSEK